jgi:hypothetical protein
VILLTETAQIVWKKGHFGGFQGRIAPGKG